MAESQDPELPIWDYSREPTAELTTTADILKPWTRPLSALVDEARIHYTNNGLHTTSVDAANVVMIDTKLHARAFDAYNLENELTVGADLSSVNGTIRSARMNHGDTLDVSVSPDELRAVIERDEYGETITTNDAMQLIDPNSIRQEPELPDLLNEHSEDYGEVTLPLDALDSVVSHVLDESGYVGFTSSDGDLHAVPTLKDAEYGNRSSAAAIEGRGVGVDGGAIYSGGYIKDILTALSRARVDDVTLAYGEELPVYFEATRTDDDDNVIMETTFMAAPRVSHD